MHTKWVKIAQLLENTLTSGQYKVWIEPLTPQWDEAGLTLIAPSEFIASFVQNRLFADIYTAVQTVAGATTTLTIACAPKNTAPSFVQPKASAVVQAVNNTNANAYTATVAQPKHNSAPKPLLSTELPRVEQASLLLPPQAATQKQPKSLSATNIDLADSLASFNATTTQKAEMLQSGHRPTPRPLGNMQLALPTPLPVAKKEVPLKNWRFSFDDFITGPSNELAFAASKTMCNSCHSTDILFLNSSPGLGKTHLMHAVGKNLSLSSNRNTPNVEYLTAEEFASHFIHSIRTNNADDFKHRYRSLDLLLLEDIHFLSGKEKTQQELLAIIKSLQERGGKLVCTSSFSPKDLQSFDDQLISRLRSGFISPIDKPDMETRKRIFRHKASMHQVLLPVEVEELLAEHIQSDVRLIESCLQNLVLKAKLFNSKSITTQMAWEVISSYAQQYPTLDIGGIIGQVCSAFNLTKTQLMSNSRKQEYVSARYTAFYLARKHTDLSLEAIGDFFNRRHSTVLKGITSLEREMSVATPQGMQLANIISMIENTSPRAQ